MTVQFNHTILWVKDPAESAQFLADMLGRPAPTRFGPFHVVDMDNDVSIDFHVTSEPVHPEHYAFLVDEGTFDEVLGRIRERQLPFWGEPDKSLPGEWNTNDGGRGLYWEEPSGHFLEIITRPYGSGG
jgi:catechol 2,3-dioxygenase-like lactoylglutathione lyase family enzyme